MEGRRKGLNGVRTEENKAEVIAGRRESSVLLWGSKGPKRKHHRLKEKEHLIDLEKQGAKHKTAAG